MNTDMKSKKLLTFAIGMEDILSLPTNVEFIGVRGESGNLWVDVLQITSAAKLESFQFLVAKIGGSVHEEFKYIGYTDGLYVFVRKL